MILDQDRQNDVFTQQVNLKTAFGVLLIFSGLGAAAGVLFEIYSLFVSPQELAIFRQLFSDRVAVTWEGGGIALPGEILAYGVPLVLLFMAGGIASTLINGGIILMHQKR
jgi:hypothetical protein